MIKLGFVKQDLVMRKIVFALCLLVSVSANATKECDEGVLSAVEWRECVATQNTKPMEKAFQNLLKAHKDNETATQAAREAQSKWEAFRDATCYYVLETDSREANAVCMDEFNKARVKILNGYIKAAKGSK